MSKEIATLAGGCFWCTEAVFQRLKGVESVTPGYTGGHIKNPSYHEVVAGDTGHAEALKIVFDPGIITYKRLLEIFFHLHDPTTLNRQGNDAGPQYRSAIFYHDTKQKETAENVIKDIEKSKLWGGRKIVTEIQSAPEFYPAENYHKNYYNENSYQPYCTYVIDPKIQKLYEDFKDEVRSIK